MTMFTDIKKGMPNGAEAIQENFETLKKGIGNISDDGVLKTKGIDTGSFFLGGREFMTKPKSLVPYLTTDFDDTYNSLIFIVSGNLATVTGTVSPKKDMGSSQGGMFTIFENLPFKFSAQQSVLQHASGDNIYELVAKGNTLSVNKHRNGNQYVPIPKTWGLKITATFIIE